MFVNTNSITSIKQSLYDILSISDKESNELINECYRLFDKNQCVFLLDQQYDFFLYYITKRRCKKIDDIQFYHYSRRLNDSDDYGYGLIDVLTKDTSLSIFMNRYGIVFRYDQYLRIYINNEKMNLNNHDHSYCFKYWKQRLGYYF